MEIISLLANYDTGAIIAILAFTSIIKTYFSVPERLVPLIPVGLGAIAGMLKFFSGVDFGEIAWYNAVADVMMNTIVYAGIASILFKVYRTTIMKNKPVITDAIKKLTGTGG
jgi:hypothetical protein